MEGRRNKQRLCLLHPYASYVMMSKDYDRHTSHTCNLNFSSCYFSRLRALQQSCDYSFPEEHASTSQIPMVQCCHPSPAADPDLLSKPSPSCSLMRKEPFHNPENKTPPLMFEDAMQKRHAPLSWSLILTTLSGISIFLSRRPARNKAGSRVSGLFVAMMIFVFPRVLWISLSAEVPSENLRPPMASISSMKMMQGSCSFA
ncbi:hypothetical protein KCU74_g29, partial [Aureobasidium melanogenum]